MSRLERARRFRERLDTVAALAQAAREDSEVARLEARAAKAESKAAKDRADEAIVEAKKPRGK